MQQRQQKAYIVPLIIVLNVIVFGLWNTNIVSKYFMFDNFLISYTALAEGRYWTLISSVFSHNALWHLLINMYVLYSFGSLLEQFLGSKTFLSFYLIAGVISSLAHAVTSDILLHTPDLPALGASGSIAGLVMIFAFMFPRQKILIFGIIPVPALWGALAFIAFDLYGLFAQFEGGGFSIGHGAHLGGSFFGVLFYFLFIRPDWQQFRERY